jgi:hypothetical protein
MVAHCSRARPDPTTDQSAAASTDYAAYGGSPYRASTDAPPSPAVTGNQHKVML